VWKLNLLFQVDADVIVFALFRKGPIRNFRHEAVFLRRV
jgi:hypothetical protein